MDKEEYKLISELQQYAKACRLVVEWAVQCGFGFDNIDDDVIDNDRFERGSDGMNYTESLIYYANMRLEDPSTQYEIRIKDRDICDLTFNAQRKDTK